MQQQQEQTLPFSLYPPKVILCPRVGDSFGSIFLDEGLVKWRGIRGDGWAAVLPKLTHDGLGTGDEPRDFKNMLVNRFGLREG